MKWKYLWCFSCFQCSDFLSLFSYSFKQLKRTQRFQITVRTISHFARLQKVCLFTIQLNLTSSNSSARRFKTAATRRTVGQKIVCFILSCISLRLDEENKNIKTDLIPNSIQIRLIKVETLTQWAAVSYRNGQRLTRVPNKFRDHSSCCLSTYLI